MENEILKSNLNIYQEIKQRIKLHEGYRDTIYADSLGFKTIGYGHLITSEDNFKENIKYSKEILEQYFEKDFSIAVKGAEELLQDIDHNFIIKGVIIEMCFQLGKPRVSKFKKMFEALKQNNLCNASEEMINSNWYKQTPTRCESLAIKIKNANK